MKKLTVLPAFCLALALSSCHLVDDDFDLPEPEKQVDEQILGTWHNHGSVAGQDTAHNGFRMYEIDTTYVTVLTDPEGANQEWSTYSLVLHDGKTYITTEGSFYGVQNYEITELTDSTMVWEKAEGDFLPDNGGNPSQRDAQLFRRTDWKLGYPWE